MRRHYPPRIDLAAVVRQLHYSTGLMEGLSNILNNQLNKRLILYNLKGILILVLPLFVMYSYMVKWMSKQCLGGGNSILFV